MGRLVYKAFALSMGKLLSQPKDLNILLPQKQG
jgi:hypothetical protein